MTTPSAPVRNSEYAGFFQCPPRPGTNAYTDDHLLQSVLARLVCPHVSATVFSDVQARLKRLGHDASNSLYDHQMADLLETPRLTTFDAWGRRVDHITVTPLWRIAARIAAEEGLVAAGYNVDAYGRARRVVQHALNYVVSPALDWYGCPLAMTDGAAATIISCGAYAKDVLAHAVPRLLSTNPATAWTSGQWMTERTGGSDVGQTTTVAIRAPGSNSLWHLHGVKFFTSATTADCAIALARPVSDSGAVAPGGRGLALFYVETRPGSDTPWGAAVPSRERHGAVTPAGSTVPVVPLPSPSVPGAPPGSVTSRPLNGIHINRLKIKLGTVKVPTAELSLTGTVAVALTPDPTGGTKAIAPMLLVTRTWNILAGAMMVRRLLALADDYASKRFAFGAPLSALPAHRTTMERTRAVVDAMTLIGFRVCELHGMVGDGGVLPGGVSASTARGVGAEEAASAGALLRVLVPIAKLVTGKQAVAAASEGIEMFGGSGYMEDTGIPRVLCDVQVLPIWEGATNVIALDVVRAMASEPAAFTQLSNDFRRLVTAPPADAAAAADVASAAWRVLEEWVAAVPAAGAPFVGATVRAFGMVAGAAYEIALLIDHAKWITASHGGGGGGGGGAPGGSDAAHLALATRLVHGAVVISDSLPSIGAAELSRALAHRASL